MNVEGSSFFWCSIYVPECQSCTLRCVSKKLPTAIWQHILTFFRIISILTKPLIFFFKVALVSSLSLIWASSFAFAFVKSLTLFSQKIVKSNNVLSQNSEKLDLYSPDHKIGSLIVISVLELNKFLYFLAQLLFSLS